MKRIHIPTWLFVLAVLALSVLAGVAAVAVSPVYAESQGESYYTWGNIDQFIDWYHNQDFGQFRIYDGVDPNGRAPTCVDYALMVQRTALKQGKMVSVSLVGGAGTYYDQWVSYPYHAGNLVIVPGATYWVEPQPDQFRVTRLSGITDK